MRLAGRVRVSDAAGEAVGALAEPHDAAGDDDEEPARIAESAVDEARGERRAASRETTSRKASRWRRGSRRRPPARRG